MTKSKTETLLAVMNVLAWLAFVGLMVNAGAIIISYGVSLRNPEGSKNLYMGLNLYNVREYNFWHYTTTVALRVAIIILESYAALLVVRVLTKIKLASPFKMEISSRLEKISYFILAIWIAVVIYDLHLDWLSKQITGIEEKPISGEFIFIAGVLFVFAQIFKKGVEIQTEHELTV